MSESDSIENPTDADYASAAREAFSAGDFVRATELIAAALSFRPCSEPHLQLLDWILDAAPRPLELVTEQPGMFYGLLAVRARILAHAQRHDEALRLLFDVVAFSPNAPYLEWADTWPAAPESWLGGSLVRFHKAARELAASDPGFASNALQAAGWARRFVARGSSDSAAVAVMASMLLRRLERYSDARDLLEAALARQPHWALWVELGAVERANGSLEAAARAFGEAHSSNPESLPIQQDYADALLALGRLPDAENLYAHALQRHPHDASVRALHLYIRAWLGDPNSRNSLLAIGASNDGARSLVSKLSLLDTELPAPSDGSALTISDAWARGAASPANQRLRVRMRISELEPPSAHVAFELALRSLAREGELVVLRDALPAGGRPAHPLWHWADGRPHPQFPPPPPSVAGLVTDIVSAPFAVDTWWQRLARESPAEAGTAAFLSMLARGVPAPRGVDPVRWLFRVQVLCACGLLHCESASNEPASWQALLNGPDSWIAGAFVVALYASARQDETARRTAIQELDRFLAHAEEWPAALAALARFKLGVAVGPNAEALWRTFQKLF